MIPRITINPKVRFGKPCVTGTRIPVQNVLELVREGCSFSEIIADYYPEITVEDIKACLQYPIDTMNLEEIHLAPGA
jgi:uncharacterized protein (DUF433 family)